MTPDIKKLLSLIKKGDELAFNKFYYYYAPIVRVHILKILGKESDVNDVLQETFAKFWKRRRWINVNKPISKYLFSSAEKISQTYLDQCLQNLTDEVEFRLQIYKVDSFESLAEKDLWAIVREAIPLVEPPACREILWMNVVEQKNYKEIAARLDIQVGVVRNQICKARRKLKELLRRK